MFLSGSVMDTEIRGSLGRNRRNNEHQRHKAVWQMREMLPNTLQKGCLISHLTSNTLSSESDIWWVTLEPFSFSTNSQFSREIASSLSHLWISRLQTWHLLISKNVFWKPTVAEFDLYSINFKIEWLIQMYVFFLHMHI